MRRSCGAALRETDAEELATAFKAIADPARLRLLSFIAAQPSAEACVCHLIEPVGLSQPTVSHHLKVLTEAGLLERERRGTWMFYRLVPARVEALRAGAGAARREGDRRQAIGMTLARRLTAEGVGTALLLAGVVGSGIMGERLAGGNVAIALLANTLATGADPGGADPDVRSHLGGALQPRGHAHRRRGRAASRGARCRAT